MSGLIKRIFKEENLNLLDNAIKYGERGVIDVSIKAEDLPNFFQKFQRGNNAKALHVNTSTGLGLYIAKMFVEGHNGRVWAKSEGLGKGSEFGF
ncbi:MAG: ATP-binding protein [bacterium]|nr:ATP-binding protein [bacterium]